MFDPLSFGFKSFRLIHDVILPVLHQFDFLGQVNYLVKLPFSTILGGYLVSSAHRINFKDVTSSGN